MAEATHTLAEHPIVESITEHVGYFTRLFPVKAGIASLLAIASDVWGWERVVFQWYCAFALLDLFLASMQALLFGTWTPKLVRLWMSKVFFELFIIVLVSGIFHSLFAITGQMLTVANWMFLLCMLTYLSSILDRLHMMGAPLPAFMCPILKAVRRRVSVNLSTLLEDDEVAKNLEQALAGRATRKVEIEQNDSEIPTATEAAQGTDPDGGQHQDDGRPPSQRAA